MAGIEAGAVGRHLQAELARHGFTLGHEPDSVEFSTLGGWIATHASGMKKNRYGNIEDLVLDVRVVTAQGILSRPAVAPRESAGLDLRRWLFGPDPLKELRRMFSSRHGGNLAGRLNLTEDFALDSTGRKHIGAEYPVGKCASRASAHESLRCDALQTIWRLPSRW